MGQARCGDSAHRVACHDKARPPVAVGVAPWIVFEFVVKTTLFYFCRNIAGITFNYVYEISVMSNDYLKQIREQFTRGRCGVHCTMTMSMTM